MPRDKGIMGEFVNSRRVDFAAIGLGVLLMALNVALVLQALGVPLPGLSAS